MITIAHIADVREAGKTSTALKRYVQVPFYAVAHGFDWTDGKDEVFLRSPGAEIVKFGRTWLTAVVDGTETRIRPTGSDARILFIIAAG